jgi:hypothetical protein
MVFFYPNHCHETALQKGNQWSLNCQIQRPFSHFQPPWTYCSIYIVRIYTVLI